ncbi:ABC-2 type transport system ATP-binding protein [Mucilaginibacter gracilis]|uniref:ABC-2 type transport system ATP-binding protein n=1 Tax=Mucilaginibacter gracilis TaxID=423350 RepID=A0A495J5T0_9SPHI|nr:ABC transporter ATP-binding protein [Mucilaginibacter gracilis]RKR83982.1 ABC-2 type transport system ATP-binding protein [Mucilaginibacter gracilis]
MDNKHNESGTTGDSIVKIENLSHRYTVQWAIKGINLQINKKGIYGLLGSNGAGKSTLMNIMCGVLKQTNGDIFINNVNVKHDPIQAKRFIGFLPQKPPLHTDLTVEEYLRYAAYLRWIPGNSVKVAIDEVLEKCNITHFRKRLIRNLSGGYQQRVGIAQAIIHRPSLVVFDEPTNGLDPNQVLEIRKLIAEIGEERTVILSTHMLTEVQAVCDYIYMVEQGQMVFQGTVNEFDNYLSPNSLLISMMNPPLTDELSSLHGVLKVEEIGSNRFRLQFIDVRDVTENIMRLSLERGWQLTEISLEKNSLDTIFAELSKKAHK